MNIDGHTRPQIVPKLLLQVSIQEPHNSLTSYQEDGGLKKARDAENNIIIVDSKIRSLLPPQLKKIQNNTRSCVVMNVVYRPKV